MGNQTKDGLYQYNEEALDNDIAITGMSVRLPGANDVDSYWRLLAEGKEAFRELTDEELSAAGVSQQLILDPNYVKVSAEIARMKQFDASFFGISAKDATFMDPQHRHFLELSWEALENAGCDTERFDGSIGVFAGSGQNTYLIWNLLSNKELLENPGFWYLRHAGNDKDFLTTRLSYHLNLHGPSVNLQTACSTSLVAVHMACQALLNRECDLSLAGGVTIMFPEAQGYLYQEGGIQSPDGHCRPFDANSKGTVFGSGAGMVVLKRLEDALRDKDTIHGVIKASAINNDGSQKAGFTAPSVDGQAAAISEALAIGDINPETIGYVEAHGTATPIGDPIEVSAMSQAWEALTDKKNFCAISSAKSNIGHLDTAAGVASLIKSVGAVKEGLKYPTVHFQSPNPALNLDDSPFYASNELEKWNSNDIPRRAAVSSLGVGGTNAHVIIEEIKSQARAPEYQRPHLLLLSARTPTALGKMQENLARFLQNNSDIRIEDVAYTLWSGRKQFDHRSAIYVKNIDHAVSALQEELPGLKVNEKATKGRDHKVVLMCTGQGAQFPGMGKELYETNTEFKSIIDTANEIVQGELKVDLKSILFSNSHDEKAADTLSRTEYAQPALFIIEYAISKLWQSKGITADYYIGHSIGEYVAATLAGVFSFENALKLVCLRGKLMQGLPSGTMVAVNLDEQDISPFLSETVDLAAVNTQGVCVLSGQDDAIADVVDKLEKRDVLCTRLHTSHAFHSSMMDPILDEFEQAVKNSSPKAPSEQFISNVTGDWITAEQAVDPSYWAKHLRSTVFFAKGVSTLIKTGESLAFIEVGPGKTLSQLVAQNPDNNEHSFSMQSLPSVKQSIRADDYFDLAFGHLWTNGYAIPWDDNFDYNQAQRIPLPTYPFEHQEFWVPVNKSLAQEVATLEKQEFNRWFYQPDWQKKFHGVTPIDFSQLAAVNLLVIGTPGQDVRQLIEAIQNSNGNVTYVSDNDAFEKHLNDKDSISHIIDCSADSLEKDSGSDLKEECFYRLLERAKSIIENGVSGLHYIAVTRFLHGVMGFEQASPLLALQYGPLRSLISETSGVCVSHWDFDRNDNTINKHFLQQLIADFLANPKELADVAYRNKQRYVLSYEPLGFDKTECAEIGETTKLDGEGEVVLITGGLGGVGLALAGQIAEKSNAKIALISRRPFPQMSEWDQLKDSPQYGNQISQLLDIKEKTQLTLLQADSSDENELKIACDTIVNELGPISTVFHAAAVIEDDLLVVKSRESIEKVLAPKLNAIDVLDKLWNQFEFEKVVLFSSVSAIVGAAGQVDYTAANAFIDAYANSYARRTDRKILSINWNTWADVGMSMESAVAQGLVETEIEIAGDSYFEYKRTTKAKEYQFLAHINTASNWELDEHRTASNIPVMPGTGYIDLAYSSFLQNNPDDYLEIQNLFFMTPVTISDGVEHVIAARIEMGTSEPDFTIATTSSLSTAKAQQWVAEHVRGTLRVLNESKPPKLDIPKIKDRCNKETEILSGKAEHKHLIWGDRWKCVEREDYGINECLIELKLNSSYSSDFTKHPLHPALLDMAIGGKKLIKDFNPDKDFFVPVSYGSIKIFGALESEIWSHVKIRPQTQPDTAEFDVTVTNSSGDVLLVVSQFIMKRVEENALDQLDAQTPSTQDQVAPKIEPKPITLLEQGLRAGIKPDEGLNAIETLLNLPFGGQYVVSSQCLSSLITATLEEKADGDDGDSEDDNAFAAPRPNLSTEYVAPNDELQRNIEKIWRAALGVDRVGIHDNFFEFGGHSLLLTQIIARLRKKLKISLPMGSLFEHSTISEWATLIEEQEPSEQLPLVKPVDRSLYAVDLAEILDEG